jgi:hypothetical protein
VHSTAHKQQISDEGRQGKNSVLSALCAFNVAIISIEVFALFISQNIYYISSNEVVDIPNLLTGFKYCIIMGLPDT